LSPRARLFSLAGFVVVLDQLSKWLVVRNIPLFGEVPVIPHFFSISHVTNTGAAFSLFAHSSGSATLALAIFSAVIIVLICVWIARTRVLTLQSISFALILGGATGNLIDRVRLRAVVDFLAVDLGSYHWPDFNLADSAIVIGALLLAYDALLGKHLAAEASLSTKDSSGI
jgi:signal peptidase II